MPKNALVTGAYGFIGRHIARRLATAGWHVSGLGHGAWSRDQWRQWGLADWHTADITLESLITYGRDPALIVHCAGSALVGFSVSHPYQDYLRTTHTTAAVLEYVRIYAAQAAVVLMSSAAVYGPAQGFPIGEAAPLRPISPYGVHKRMAEELCQSYARQYEVRAAVVRFFSVYGPGLRKQLLWDACNGLARGEGEFGGTGAERRDWLHVDDGASLVVTAAEHASSSCPIVNGGSGSSPTVREVLEHLAERVDKAGSVRFSGAVRPGDPNRYEADISLARSWGWRPTVDWRSGVDAFASWFKAGAV